MAREGGTKEIVLDSFVFSMGYHLEEHLLSGHSRSHPYDSYMLC